MEGLGGCGTLPVLVFVWRKAASPRQQTTKLPWGHTPVFPHAGLYPHYLYSPPGEDYSADSPASASFFSSRAIFASASSNSFCSCAAVFTFVNVFATGAAPLPALAGSKGAVRGAAFAPAHLRANQPVSWVHPMIPH